MYPRMQCNYLIVTSLTTFLMLPKGTISIPTLDAQSQDDFYAICPFQDGFLWTFINFPAFFNVLFNNDKKLSDPSLVRSGSRFFTDIHNQDQILYELLRNMNNTCLLHTCMHI